MQDVRSANGMNDATQHFTLRSGTSTSPQAVVPPPSPVSVSRRSPLLLGLEPGNLSPSF